MRIICAIAHYFGCPFSGGCPFSSKNKPVATESSQSNTKNINDRNINQVGDTEEVTTKTNDQ